MRAINIYNPGKVSVGAGCIEQLANDVLVCGIKKVFLITVSAVLKDIDPVISSIKKNGVEVEMAVDLPGEPTFGDFEGLLKKASGFKTDCVVGIGGGSIMDVAKIVAVLIDSDQKLKDVVGIGLLTGRKTKLFCAPTTSGTGSEMSPNSILLDESDNSKKGIISPFLVPDYVYIDPVLTIGLPSNITAFTGVDALTHCIEAYCNKNAHPVVDAFAMEGITLIAGSLENAVLNGDDVEARTNLAIGSMYGGMCLGPVNTAAVHAMAYPLGSEYHIAHGLSNALLLPYVMEFNLDANYQRYADVAVALGAGEGNDDIETAQNGILILKNLLKRCGVPSSMKELGVEESKITQMAQSALKVTRLMMNNLKEISLDDAITIYKNAY